MTKGGKEGDFMEDILDMLKKNEEIARKFLEVESVLKPACTPSELMETLLRQLERSFLIPYAWFTFVDRPGNEELISRLAMTESLREEAGFLDEASFAEILPQRTSPVLANENLRLFYKLFPLNRKYFLKSIAVVPLILRGQLIGSLNLGDASPERYSEGMDASLLQQLVDEVSERLDRMMYPRDELPAESDAFLRNSERDPGVSGSE